MPRRLAPDTPKKGPYVYKFTDMLCVSADREALMADLVK